MFLISHVELKVALIKVLIVMGVDNSMIKINIKIFDTPQKASVCVTESLLDFKRVSLFRAGSVIFQSLACLSCGDIKNMRNLTF